MHAIGFSGGATATPAPSAERLPIHDRVAPDRWVKRWHFYWELWRLRLKSPWSAKLSRLHFYWGLWRLRRGPPRHMPDAEDIFHCIPTLALPVQCRLPDTRPLSQDVSGILRAGAGVVCMGMHDRISARALAELSCL